MKLIHSEKLKKYVENKREVVCDGLDWDDMDECQRFAVEYLDDILSFITSFQQVQPKVDLSEETLREGFHTIDRKCFDEGISGWQREKLIARHFYELGLNARKNE